MALSEEQKEQIKAASDKTFPFVERCGARTLEVDRGYCKMMMPLPPSLNHVGIMYAGALYTIAELPGGVIYMSSFDTRRFYPIVKDMQIRFRRPATTDVTVEVRITDQEIERIRPRRTPTANAILNGIPRSRTKKGKWWRSPTTCISCAKSAAEPLLGEGQSDIRN